MAGFRLVIFDNDGVLLDSEPLAAEAMSEVLSALGLPFSPEQCDALFGGGALQRTREVAEARFGLPLPAEFEDRYSARLVELMAATPAASLSGADRIFTDMAELPQLLLGFSATYPPEIANPEVRS